MLDLNIVIGRARSRSNRFGSALEFITSWRRISSNHGQRRGHTSRGGRESGRDVEAGEGRGIRIG